MFQLGKGTKIGGIIVIVFLFLVVAAIVYESPTESNTTDEEKTSGFGEPFLDSTMDTIKEKFVGTYIPPAPTP